MHDRGYPRLPAGLQQHSSGQVLQEPYDWHKAKLIVREMTDLLVLDLVKKRLCTDQLTLTIGYDIENLSDPARAAEYAGETHVDRYGRRVRSMATERRISQATRPPRAISRTRSWRSTTALRTKTFLSAA